MYCFQFLKSLKLKGSDRSQFLPIEVERFLK